jgi:hypothetical protein
MKMKPLQKFRTFNKLYLYEKCPDDQYCKVVNCDPEEEEECHDKLMVKSICTEEKQLACVDNDDDEKNSYALINIWLGADDKEGLNLPESIKETSDLFMVDGNVSDGIIDEEIESKHFDKCKGPVLFEQTCNGDQWQEMMIKCSDLRQGAYCSSGHCVISPFEDADEDGVDDLFDNCPLIANSDQEDSDQDGKGDICDNCINAKNTDQVASDSDSFGDVCDNCLNIPNEDQMDSDNNGKGDACDEVPCIAYSGDTDISDPNGLQKCANDYSSFLEMFNQKWAGIKNLPDDAGWMDVDNDGIPDVIEECLLLTNKLLPDTDGDGLSDSEELIWQYQIGAYDGTFHPEYGETNPIVADTDGDGLTDHLTYGNNPDVCPLNPSQYCDDACVKTEPEWSCTSKLVHMDNINVENDGLKRIRWAADAPVIVASGFNSRVAWSIDGGENWKEFKLIPKTGPSSMFQNQDDELYYHVSMTSNGQKIRVTANRNIYKSDDGGETWDFGFYGPISWANDSGERWTTQAVEISQDGSVEYAVGDGGAIWMKVDDGEWQLLYIYLEFPSSIKSSLYDIATDETGEHIIVSGFAWIVTVGEISLPVGPLKQIRLLEPDSRPIMSSNGYITLAKSVTAPAGEPLPDDIKYAVDFSNDFDLPLQPPANGQVGITIQPSGQIAAVVDKRGVIWVTMAKFDDSGTTQIGKVWRPVKTDQPLVLGWEYNDIAISPTGKEFIVIGKTIENSFIYKIECN